MKRTTSKMGGGEPVTGGKRRDGICVRTAL